MNGSGKLKCITATIEGKRYYCYGKTLSEASKKLEDRKLRLKLGLPAKGGPLTLDGYFEYWERLREGSVRSATERCVREGFKRISCFSDYPGKEKLGDMRLTEIDRDEVLNLQQTLSRSLSFATVNSTTGLLKRIFNQACRDGLIEKNPCDGIKPLQKSGIPARETIHRALSREETRIFFEYAVSSWYYSLFLFLLLSGVRCGEAGALKYTDIKENTIEIRRTVTRTTGGYRVGSDAKTGASRRDIPLTPALKALFDDMKPDPDFNSDTSDDGLVFSSPEGRMVLSSNVDKEIKRLCRLSGLEPFTAHAFRDTFATRAIESGMNPKTLQEILGHSSYGITMTLYAHAMPSTKSKEMSSIDFGIE